MNLLSDNDWNQLSNAMRQLESLSLTRALGSLEITAETSRAPNPWPVAMLVGVKVERNGRIEQRQWFESVEQAQREVRRWRY